MTLDFVAERYGILPSKVIESGDTLDIRIANLAVQYANWKRNNPGIKNDHGLTQEQLLEIHNRAKNKQR